MVRPTELEMDTSEPSVATEWVEFDRIWRRMSSTFGSCSGGFRRKLLNHRNFADKPAVSNVAAPTTPRRRANQDAAEQYVDCKNP